MTKQDRTKAKVCRGESVRFRIKYSPTNDKVIDKITGFLGRKGRKGPYECSRHYVAYPFYFRGSLVVVSTPTGGYSSSIGLGNGQSLYIEGAAVEGPTFLWICSDKKEKAKEVLEELLVSSGFEDKERA